VALFLKTSKIYSMANNINASTSDIPKGVWYAIAALIAFVVIFIVLQVTGVIKKVFGGVSDIFSSASGALTDEDSERLNNEVFDNINVNNNNLSNVNHSALASNLHNAMSGFGTDFVEIKKTFRRLNADDVKKIYKSFGTQPYFVVGFSLFGQG
jgi:hypothetical protein